VLAGLFTFDQAASTVRGGLLLLLFLFASYFGLRWKHLAFGIAASLALETSVTLATFALEVHLGSLRQADLFADFVRCLQLLSLRLGGVRFLA
jgi:hypothetical protein